MNEKQKQFCLEYLKCFIASRAYRNAYENDVPLKNPGAGAYKLLARDDVREFLAKRIKKMEQRRIAEAEEVMAYFTSVMRGEIEMSDRERNKAAEILAKRFGLLQERLPGVNEEGGITIVDDLG